MSDNKAVFGFYWQLGPNEHAGAFYHVQGGDRHGSTVSAKTLREIGIDIPPTPTYTEWVESGSPVNRLNKGA